MASVNITKNNNSTNLRRLFFVINIIWNTIWLLLLVIVILRIFVFQQVQVDGKSMYPNYDDKQFLVVNQIDKSFQRGQVVAAYANRAFADEVKFKMNPINSYFARFSPNAKFYLKRIVGLPGEEIEIIGGKVIIYNKENPSGSRLIESYIPQSTITSENDRDYYLPRTKIPATDYFLMGDNRSNSYDSRALGTFADFAIFGKETFRVIPFEDRHIFQLPDYTFDGNISELKTLINEKQKNLK